MPLIFRGFILCFSIYSLCIYKVELLKYPYLDNQGCFIYKPVSPCHMRIPLRWLELKITLYVLDILDIYPFLLMVFGKPMPQAMKSYIYMDISWVSSPNRNRLGTSYVVWTSRLLPIKTRTLRSMVQYKDRCKAHLLLRYKING